MTTELAPIDRAREAKEAEELRAPAAVVAEHNRAAQADLEREQKERVRQIRERATELTAQEIAHIVALEVGVTASWIAGRIAEIPHAHWVALAGSEDASAELAK